MKLLSRSNIEVTSSIPYRRGLFSVQNALWRPIGTADPEFSYRIAFCVIEKRGMNEWITGLLFPVIRDPYSRITSCCYVSVIPQKPSYMIKHRHNAL